MLAGGGRSMTILLAGDGRGGGSGRAAAHLLVVEPDPADPVPPLEPVAGDELELVVLTPPLPVPLAAAEPPVPAAAPDAAAELDVVEPQAGPGAAAVLDELPSDAL